VAMSSTYVDPQALVNRSGRAARNAPCHPPSATVARLIDAARVTAGSAGLLRSEHGCSRSRRPPYSPPPEEQVRNATAAGHGLEVEPVEQILVAAPESLPSADLDRRDGNMDGVDEIRLEELP
jgi:hypothetical protein